MELLILAILIVGGILTFRKLDRISTSRVSVEPNKRQSETYRQLWSQRSDFFKESVDGAAYMLEWWQQYAESAPDTGQPSVPTLLRRARRQAEQGLKVMEEMEADFHRLLEDFSQANRELADQYLEALLVTQDRAYRNNKAEVSDYLGGLNYLDCRAPESVLSILDAVGQRLNMVEGWARYKQQYSTYCQRLISLLDSPAVNSRMEEYRQRLERFPDPNQVQQQDVQSDPAADRLNKRLDKWEKVGAIALVAHFVNQTMNQNNNQNNR